MSRANQWFVPGDGIAREVITADIQRYLGPDALVRPGSGTGEYQSQPGYWITAYRTLTSQMIQDLKLDSQRWQQERQPGSSAGRGVAYQDSQTHAARQHWGPSKPYDQPAEPSYQEAPQSRSSSSRIPYSATSYDSRGSSEGHYALTSNAHHASAHPGYTAAPASSAPRTQPTDTYYQQPSGRGEYPAAQPSTYAPYTNQGQPEGYGRQAPAAGQYGTTPSVSTPSPGYYIASDGRQYPLSQQPQPSKPSNPGGGPRRY